MCGITGIYNYGGASNLISEARLKPMVSCIQHRGPDDEGIYISDDHRTGLGFRRLSIIDLSDAGHQPMSNATGTIWIVFNGEIYNHSELRSILVNRGYTYRSQTDTETILYAYEEYGIEFVEKLVGMYAIAIWDARIGSLFLVRDRIGIKPLYYLHHDGAVFFGSEIKSILAHPSVSPDVNLQGLYDYLSVMTTPPGESMFRNIYKLTAGTYLEIRRNGEISETTYWDVLEHSATDADERFSDEQYCIDNIRSLLRDSIKLRMMADVPFGVLLSGGIDSSLNVALMSELMDRPVQTFSAGFKQLEKYNELEYARKIARQFGTNHHEILLEEQDVIDFLPRMVWHQDEPNGDPVCAPMHFVSRLARENGTIVVQVGEGSDEQFSGYRHYLKEIHYFRSYYSRLPVALQTLMYHGLRAVRPHSLLTDYFRRGPERDVPFYGGALSFSEEAKRRLLNEATRATLEQTGRIARRYMNSTMPGTRNGVESDYLKQMVGFEIKSRLAELLLMRVDKMSMATSIEARVPFLDHRLVEFSMRIPDHLKIKGGEPKYILKRASEGIIPNEIIYRRKQGFAAPVTEWLREGKLRSFARERIFESRPVRDGLFDRNYIELLFTRHAAQHGDHSVQLWSLLVLSLWYDIYIDGSIRISR